MFVSVVSNITPFHIKKPPAFYTGGLRYESLVDSYDSYDSCFLLLKMARATPATFPMPTPPSQ